MITRLDILNDLNKDPWLKSRIIKLKASDLAIVKDFVAINDSLSIEDFEKSINRLFLDKPKPKQWTLILEILSAINSKKSQSQS